MATNFPASLDSLTNPTSSDSLNSPSHSAQHANVNDAVEALQAKVGVDSSAVSSSLDYKVAALEAISHGKILQIVRATDTTQRVTSSTSFVDITGLSVTITPTSASSTILVFLSINMLLEGTTTGGVAQITDSSNVALDGAEGMEVQDTSAGNPEWPVFTIGYDSPATTSATTYKARFRRKAAGTYVAANNQNNTGQIYAIEVGA